MRIEITEPKRPKRNLESLQFISFLKGHDPRAWKLLKKTYELQIANLLWNKMLFPNTFDEAIDQDYLSAVGEITKHLCDEVWREAERYISDIDYHKEGDLLKWLSHTTVRVAQEYTQTSATECNEFFIKLLQCQYKPAWEQAAESYSSALLQTGRYKLESLDFKDNSQLLAEDALQQTWINAKINIAGFRYQHQKGFLNWLQTLQRNVIRNLARRERMRAYVPLDDESLSDNISLAVRNRPVEDEVIERELINAFEKAIAGIILEEKSETNQHIIQRLFIYGQKPSQISQILSVENIHVHELNRKIKIKLRSAQELQDYLPKPACDKPDVNAEV